MVSLSNVATKCCHAVGSTVPKLYELLWYNSQFPGLPPLVWNWNESSSPATSLTAITDEWRDCPLWLAWTQRLTVKSVTKSSTSTRASSSTPSKNAQFPSTQVRHCVPLVPVKLRWAFPIESFAWSPDAWSKLQWWISAFSRTGELLPLVSTLVGTVCLETPGPSHFSCNPAWPPCSKNSVRKWCSPASSHITPERSRIPWCPWLSTTSISLIHNLPPSSLLR